MIQHYLNFITSQHGLLEITEPIGFDAAEFAIQQDDKRHGRDVIYAGGNNKLRITNCAEYENVFDKLLYNKHFYGFETVIEYKVQFNEDDYTVGELTDIVTDGLTYVEFSVIEVGKKALFKQRYDTPTDMNATETLDGINAEPPAKINVFRKAKPVIAISEWINPQVGQQTFHDNPSANADYVMAIKQQTKYDIKDSSTWLFDNNTDDDGAFENFIFIDSKTNKKDIVIEFFLDMVYDYLPQSGLDEAGQVLLRVYYGQTPETATQINVWDSIAFTQETAQQQILPTYLEANIPVLNNTDKLWISFVSATNNGAINRLTWNECTIKITATEIAFSTVIPMLRLHDVMRYNAQLSALLPIDAPHWAEGGKWYDTFITTEPLMRRLYDKPFNISTKEIVEDILPVFNADYQLQPTDLVYYGVYEDFYRNYEVLNADMYVEQIEGFTIDTNPEFYLKRVDLDQPYASERESTTENTYDIVHGKYSGMLPNKKATNVLDIKIKAIIDAFLWEQAAQRAYNLSDTTATQDSDKKYLLDVVEMGAGDRYQTETATLQHRVPEENRLVLTNQTNFSWVQLGIGVGTSFAITSEKNAGIYLVISVTDTVLTLLATNDPEDDDIDNTTFTYFIAPFVTNYINRTDEGFTEIENIEDGHNYSNLPHTSKRIVKRYEKQLATACMYKPDEPIKTVEYKNNPEALTEYTGETEPIIEGEDWIPEGAICHPDLITLPLLITMKQMFDFQENQRLQNGFIRTWNSDGTPLKLYVKDFPWTALTQGELDDANLEQSPDILGVAQVVGKRKFEPELMDILGVAGEAITINGEIIPSNWHWQFDFNGKLYIFDGNEKLLFVPVYYNMVRVNNSGQATSTTELAQWLNNII